MDRLNEFRVYYNHTLYPELMRLEQLRRRSWQMLMGSVLVLVVAIIVGSYVRVYIVGVLLAIPLVIYIVYLSSLLSRFRYRFKPRVVNLVLDFIAPRQMQYDQRRSISKSRFQRSLIFDTPAHFFQGEDYISGTIGEVRFEMCELDVRENSRTDNELEEVFKGIFLHAMLKKGQYDGRLVIYPRKYYQYLTRSMKTHTALGAEEVEPDDPFFDELFVSFASRDMPVHKLLSQEVMDMLIEFYTQKGKDLYLSFIHDRMYIGVAEPRDILEPNYTDTVVSFDLVREFFEDLQLVFTLVEEFDLHH